MHTVVIELLALYNQFEGSGIMEELDEAH